MSIFAYESTAIKHSNTDNLYIDAEGKDSEDQSRLAWGSLKITFGKSRSEGLMLDIGFGGRQSGEFVGVSNISLSKVRRDPLEFDTFQLSMNSPDMKSPWCESFHELCDKLFQPAIDKMASSYEGMSREQKFKTRSKFDGRLLYEDPNADPNSNELSESNLTHNDMKELLGVYKNVNLNDTTDLRQMQAKLPSIDNDWDLSPFQRGMARLSVMTHMSVAVNGLDIFKAPMLAMMKEMSSTKLEDIADPKVISKGSKILAPYMMTMPKNSQEYHDFVKLHWSTACS